MTTIQKLYELFLHNNPVVTTDSRNCPKGSIFFALKGARFDGNLFAEKALASGCNYAVIDNPEYFTGERTILVENVVYTLQQLAHLHRVTLGVPLLAITGTNGKTTTKELVAAVLSTRFKVLYTEGNLNNHIGVPLTLLRLNHTHEMAVIEMGANHPGEIKKLAEIAQPDYGMITNVGCAHLEGFGSFANILKTKGELYDYIGRTHGRVFLKKENPYLQSLAEGITQVTYGCVKNAFVSGQIIRSDPFLVFSWEQERRNNLVETRLIGSYNIDNVLAAVAIGRYFRIPSKKINRAIESYKPSNNRSQWVNTAGNHLIVDAYNANPTSMTAALENFAALSRSPKAIILGDMLELGDMAKALHKDIVDLIKTLGFDEILLCGSLFSEVTKDFRTFPTTDHLAGYLQAHPLKGYHVLLKGSRGIALEKIVGCL